MPSSSSTAIAPIAGERGPDVGRACRRATRRGRRRSPGPDAPSQRPARGRARAMPAPAAGSARRATRRRTHVGAELIHPPALGPGRRRRTREQHREHPRARRRRPAATSGPHLRRSMPASAGTATRGSASVHGAPSASRDITASAVARSQAAPSACNPARSTSRTSPRSAHADPRRPGGAHDGRDELTRHDEQRAAHRHHLDERTVSLDGPDHVGMGQARHTHAHADRWTLGGIRRVPARRSSAPPPRPSRPRSTPPHAVPPRRAGPDVQPPRSVARPQHARRGPDLPDTALRGRIRRSPERARGGSNP